MPKFFARCILSLLAISALCLAETGQSSSSVSVITNASVDSHELTLTELRAIFTMKKRLWSDGEGITVYVLNDDETAHSEFSKRVLGVLPRQLKAIWQRLTFSGTGRAPIELDNQQDMLRNVEQTPGSIGYIFSENINENVNEISVLK